MSLDSTVVKVHHDGTGALKIRPIRHWQSRGGWTTKIHMVAANARTAITFALWPTRRSRAVGQTRRGQIAYPFAERPRIRGEETRQLALDLNFIPVVPPKSNRVTAWEYDREMYKRRNEIERLFRRLKGFRRIFSRFEKLDVMFIAFIHFALIIEALRQC